MRPPQVYFPTTGLAAGDALALPSNSMVRSLIGGVGEEPCCFHERRVWVFALSFAAFGRGLVTS